MHDVAAVVTENGFRIALDHEQASQSVTVQIDPPDGEAAAFVMGRSDWRVLVATLAEFERQREAGFPDAVRHG